MAKEFKTSPRRRELSANTRRKRLAAGKPVQPNVVDEALSVAVMKASRQNVRATNAGRPVPPVVTKAFDALLASAIDHLVDVRGLDREQSKHALQARLFKRRRYTSIAVKKG